MQLSPHNDLYPSRELSDRPKFNVVIIYEDRPTGRRAKYFYEKVVRALEDDCDFNLELWNFQVLAISEIGNSAAQVVARADFVILSFHDKAGLPVEIRDWIETCSRLLTDTNAVLIALADKPETRGGVPVSTLAYLRTLAERAGIDFFAHTVFCRSTN